MKNFLGSLLALLLLHNPCGNALCAEDVAQVFQTSAAPGLSRDLPWVDSYAAAMNQARAEGKTIVLLFTGTDWCPWCKVLERDILNAPGFAEALQGKFLFVRLDFPRSFALPPEVTQENKRLADFYKINSYPTLVVLDTSGRVLAKTGVPKISPLQFANELMKLRQ